jgi:hypothetical protein
MKKLILGSAIVMCIVSSSCKKEKANSNCEKTVASIAGTYSVVKVEVGFAGNFTDVALEPCQVDDKLTLNADGTTVYKDLGTVCEPSGDETGTWGISSSGKMTIANGTIGVNEADITSFDCSTLVLTATDSDSGAKVRLTIKK